MRKDWVSILLSSLLSFGAGMLLLFVGLYALLFISGYGVDVGEEMPGIYIPFGISIILAYIALLIFPLLNLYKKMTSRKIQFLIISAICFCFGIIGSILIFERWN